MIRRQYLLLIVFNFILANQLLAQLEFDPRKDFTYHDDYFKPYSPYITANIGYGYNAASQKEEQNLAVDYHFRLKYEYLHFNIGYLSSTDQFLIKGDNGIQIYRSIQRCHNLHFGAGTRYSILRHNFGIYGGISLVGGIHALNETTGMNRLGPGIYAQAHYHFKPIYDIGAGVNIYVAISEHFKVFGIQFSILFAADFKPPVKARSFYD